MSPWRPARGQEEEPGSAQSPQTVWKASGRKWGRRGPQIAGYPIRESESWVTLWAGKVTTQAKGGLWSWQCWEALQSLGTQSPSQSPFSARQKIALWFSFHPEWPPLSPLPPLPAHHTHTHTRGGQEGSCHCPILTNPWPTNSLDSEEPPHFWTDLREFSPPTRDVCRAQDFSRPPGVGVGGLQGLRQAPRRQARDPAELTARRTDPGE